MHVLLALGKQRLSSALFQPSQEETFKLNLVFLILLMSVLKRSPGRIYKHIRMKMQRIQQNIQRYHTLTLVHLEKSLFGCSTLVLWHINAQ